MPKLLHRSRGHHAGGVFDFMRHGDRQTANAFANHFGSGIREVEPHVRANIAFGEEGLPGNKGHIVTNSFVTMWPLFPGSPSSPKAMLARTCGSTSRMPLPK